MAPSPSSVQWFPWASLPEDMQVLLQDYLEVGQDWHPPTGLWARPIALDRLPTARLDDETPNPQAERRHVDRGVEHARAVDLQQTPPLGIGQGRWLDGRHRVFAARERNIAELLAFDLTHLVPLGHLAQFGGLGPVAPLHAVHTITAGRHHANALPQPPPGRKLERLWTLTHADRLAQLGPEHNVSAFLEDRLHDYQIDREGCLRFYSRVVATDSAVEVVLDYETREEMNQRRAMARPAPTVAAVEPPKPGKRRRTP